MNAIIRDVLISVLRRTGTAGACWSCARKAELHKSGRIGRNVCFPSVSGSWQTTNECPYSAEQNLRPQYSRLYPQYTPRTPSTYSRFYIDSSILIIRTAILNFVSATSSPNAQPSQPLKPPIPIPTYIIAINPIRHMSNVILELPKYAIYIPFLSANIHRLHLHVRVLSLAFVNRHEYACHPIWRFLEGVGGIE
ncbi:hypothetical protein B0H34DRAFT_389991 [Crassisporium funariophilum]|nr:hypothetical protein B0H34DRAFT_389991 [Crassisporium funariophilum]